MVATLKQWMTAWREAFWVLPMAMVLGGMALALTLIEVERSGAVPHWLSDNALVYDGGADGALTLLGAVVASTIGVAGTVFSITIAALTLAAGQMGPRLLHNFTRDRGNQFTLGAFLGSFAYALLVLRSVSSLPGSAFVPHLALSGAIVLTLLCVATLVYFVGHMAGRINVDTVIELVSMDFQHAIDSLLSDAPRADGQAPLHWQQAAPVRDDRRGYLQHIDVDGLSRWAAEHDTTLRLLVRQGQYVFPGAPIALMQPPVEGAAEAVAGATALGATRMSSDDLEDAVRRLVEVAVRALSPGINDPNTALSVLDRLGAGLCHMATLHMPSGLHSKEGRVALVVPVTDYDGLLDAMFHMIRQNAVTQPAVLIRMLQMLSAVASCETGEQRLAALQRHADLVLADAERSVGAEADREEVRACHRQFTRMRRSGVVAALGDGQS